MNRDYVPSFTVTTVATVAAMLMAFVMSQMLVGCAAQTHDHGHAVKAPKQSMAKEWKPGKRCKQIGKAKTSHVAVLVERNCLKNGLTTVNMLVLNSEKKGLVAADHAAQAVTSILGYKPTLKVLVYGKSHGKVFFLAAVTESTGPVARR